MMVSIELPYPSLSGNHHTRGAAGGRRYLTKDAQAYRICVAVAVGTRRAPPGPLHCDWLIAPPDSKARDTDNLMKVVKDALTLSGFWPDDSNRVLPRGCWEWAPPVAGGRILLSVKPL